MYVLTDLLYESASGDIANPKTAGYLNRVIYVHYLDSTIFIESPSFCYVIKPVFV